MRRQEDSIRRQRQRLWLRIRRRIDPRLRLDFALHAKALPFNDHRFRVMQEPIQDGGRQHAVIVKDLGPLFVGSIRRDHDRPLLIAKRDDLEEQIGSGLVNG